jgi:hypothetical protein
MSSIPFSLLYSVCLAVCLGLVESLKNVSVEPVVSLSVPVTEVVAIPPRPEGIRPSTGAGEQVSEENCRNRTGSLRDICFTELARSRAVTDVEGAILACSDVGDRSRSMECVAAVAEVHAPTNRKAALAICPTISHKKWSDQCVFGIGLALAKIDPPWAYEICGSAGMWRDFCRHDVNGEIALFDVDLSLRHCASVADGELAEKSCWHGIGKYLGRVDTNRARTACDRVPVGIHQDNCVHGLGWAGAERSGMQFEDICSTLDVGADACRLGVAYQQIRVNPNGAARVCEKVVDAGLRVDCEGYVRGSKG